MIIDTVQDVVCIMYMHAKLYAPTVHECIMEYNLRGNTV